MLIDELKNIQSGLPELRKFGFVMAVVLAGIGGYAWWMDAGATRWWLSVAAFLAACALSVPLILWPVQKIWMGFAVLMGYIMTRVILCLLFYLIVTPIGLTMRMFGKDPLAREFDRSASSYWIPRTAGDEEISRSEVQF